MKANQKFLNENHAQAGIGTLIIFIAMVLVAAVAAAVLISTQGLLQQKAQKTGAETITEVTSNLLIVSVVGTSDGSGGNLTRFDVSIKPAAGAGNIDLNKLKITMTDGVTAAAYVTPNSTTFDRDPDTSSPVMNSGDLVTIKLPTTGFSIGPRSYYKIIMIPENGNPVTIEGTAPSTFGKDVSITLK